MSYNEELYKECFLLNKIISAKYEYLKLMETKEANSSHARVISVFRSSILRYLASQIYMRMSSDCDLTDFPESKYFFKSIGIAETTSENLMIKTSVYELVMMNSKDLEEKINSFLLENDEDALTLFYVNKLRSIIDHLRRKTSPCCPLDQKCMDFQADSFQTKMVPSHFTKKDKKCTNDAMWSKNEEKSKNLPIKFISSLKKFKKRLHVFSSSEQLNSDVKSSQTNSECSEMSEPAENKPKNLTDERIWELFDELKRSSTRHSFLEKTIMLFCDVCRKYILRGVVCKQCRVKCHDKCAENSQNVCINKNKYKDFIEKLKLEADSSQNVVLMASKMKATLLYSPLETPSGTPASTQERSSFKESEQMEGNYSFVFPDWEIEYEELKFGKKLEKRQFSTVFRGHWHGDVTIKVFRGTRINREMFIREVSLLMTIRHESIVHFVGMCTEPPHLIIVTRFCQGRKLNDYIRSQKRRITYKRRISLALQISQALGYLHSRGILHCDIRPQNIFVDNGRVTVTNFGLFNLTTSPENENKNYFKIEHGWLSYLAPEIIRVLKYPAVPQNFTESSDVFAFGSLFYEMVSMKRSFADYLPHQVIFLVGMGLVPPIGWLEVPTEVMDVISSCMRLDASLRPTFPFLINRLSVIFAKHKKNMSMKVRLK